MIISALLRLVSREDRGFVNCTVNDQIFSRFVLPQVDEINIIVESLNGIK